MCVCVCVCVCVSCCDVQKNVTALHLAALRENEDMIDILIAAGAEVVVETDVSVRSLSGTCALMIVLPVVPRCPSAPSVAELCCLIRV